MCCLAVGADRPDRESFTRPGFFSHQSFPFYTLFDGQFVLANDLPWTYLPTYIALARLSSFSSCSFVSRLR